MAEELTSTYLGIHHRRHGREQEEGEEESMSMERLHDDLTGGRWYCRAGLFIAFCDVFGCK
jgi:hypothetical protein